MYNSHSFSCTLYTVQLEQLYICQKIIIIMVSVHCTVYNKAHSVKVFNAIVSTWKINLHYCYIFSVLKRKLKILSDKHFLSKFRHYFIFKLIDNPLYLSWIKPSWYKQRQLNMQITHICNIMQICAFINTNNMFIINHIHFHNHKKIWKRTKVNFNNLAILWKNKK